MYLHEFNTDKMTWEKSGFGTAQFSLTGLIIRFNDNDYFNQNKNIILNLVNKKCNLILIDHTRNNSYVLSNIRIAGIDIVNARNVSNTMNNVWISAMIHESVSNITDLNNYWLYLQYE